ncbi:hypothetical protein K402DRAFT_423239 [Aulographum hederae CBS 113979]|uniref:Uncharacterized protein n=1 Tax=Aulographum hederae CBS 113979 TaxID=1176131 RepID=A0A6G1GSK0_9PEZI|nr:hypothetical protein K402DRAFT_423239 [Aulographum hederae CBS 113979]
MPQQHQHPHPHQPQQPTYIPLQNHTHNPLPAQTQDHLSPDKRALPIPISIDVRDAHYITSLILPAVRSVFGPDVCVTTAHSASSWRALVVRGSGGSGSVSALGGGGGVKGADGVDSTEGRRRRILMQTADRGTRTRALFMLLQMVEKKVAETFWGVQVAEMGGGGGVGEKGKTVGERVGGTEQTAGKEGKKGNGDGMMEVLSHKEHVVEDPQAARALESAAEEKMRGDKRVEKEMELFLELEGSTPAPPASRVDLGVKLDKIMAHGKPRKPRSGMTREDGMDSE